MENSEETVKLGHELVIHNVLYVPNLKCNLISIKQYDVYFSKNMYVMHDHTLKKKVGLGILAHVVYNRQIILLSFIWIYYINSKDIRPFL